MTQPTKEQSEAAEIANRLREIAVTLLASTSEDWVVLKAADMLTALTAAAGAEKPSGPRVRFRCMTCGALSGDDAYDDCAEVAQWQCFECSIK